MSITLDPKIPQGSIVIESGLKFAKTIILAPSSSNKKKRVIISPFDDSDRISFYLNLLLSDSETVQEYLKFFRFRVLYDVYFDYYSFKGKDMYSINKTVSAANYINDEKSYEKTLNAKRMDKGDVLEISRLGLKDINYTIRSSNSSAVIHTTSKREIGGCIRKEEGVFPPIVNYDLFEFILDVSVVSIDSEDSPDWMYNYLGMMNKLIDSTGKSFKKIKSCLSKVYYDNKMRIEQPTNEDIHYVIKGLGRVNCMTVWHMVENMSEIEKYYKYEKAF